MSYQPKPAAWQRKHPTEGWVAVNEDDISHYREQGQPIRSLYAITSTADDKDGRTSVEKLERLLRLCGHDAYVKVSSDDLTFIHSDLIWAFNRIAELELIIRPLPTETEAYPIGEEPF